ncbi:MAG: endonuclease III, partial [Prochlorothrix sp.]|nr:endonuclease III [Prochlorothrix sp.]
MSIALLLDRLSRAYPNATYALNWTSPEQLLIGAILAAQTTDERVNQVTPALFHAYPSIAALAAADRSALETLLQPTGYYRRKAATVQAVCQALVDRFGGKVPPRMADLVQLPGVGRKTANVVLNCAFNQPSGIIIDTHGIRVNRRLGLTAKTQADAIETDLMAQIPQESWIQWGNAIILHGRAVCQAKTPRCHACDLRDLCPQVGVQGQATTGSQQLGLLDLESLELESSEPGSLELGLTDRSGQTSNTQPNPKFQQQPSQQPNPKSQQQSNPKSQQQFSQQPNPRSQQQPSQQPNPKSQQQPSQQP